QYGASQPIGDVRRLGRRGNVGALVDGVIEQRHIRPQRSQPEQPAAGVYRGSGHVDHAVRIERPQEDADILNVVTTATAADAADIDQVGRAIEGTVNVQARLPTTQVWGVVVIGTDVLGILRGGEVAEQLNGVRTPSSDVTCQLLQHQDRALAA